MVPMRSVPHRVVCLVGLDDGVFPRAASVDGDDVLARRPLTGERDARSEDRQLLLDAVLAATETLVVTYTGANEHTGAARPPAVPLGEILDAADRTAATPVRDRVLVRHPLAALRRPQPRSRARLVGRPSVQLRPGRAGRRPVAAAGARAHRRRSCSTGRSRRGRASDVIAGRPARRSSPTRSGPSCAAGSTWRRRSSPTRSATRSRSTSTRWSSGRSATGCCARCCAGQDPVAVMTAEQLRGTLPPGGLGRACARRRGRGVPEALRPHRRAARRRARSRRRRRRPRRRPPAHRHRRPASTAPGSSRSATPGSSRGSGCWPGSTCWRSAPPTPTSTGPPTPSAASAPGRSGRWPARSTTARSSWLRDLVELRDLGLTRPLPVPLADRLRLGRGARPGAAGRRPSTRSAAASRAWETDPHNALRHPRRGRRRLPRRVYGDARRSSGCSTTGWPTYAWRIWEPLLTGAERVGPL